MNCSVSGIAPRFLLVAGGSSILAGDPPDDSPGWSCGLGEDDASQRFLLTHASLSGSGLAVKGTHILDPRTGPPRICGKTAPGFSPIPQPNRMRSQPRAWF